MAKFIFSVRLNETVDPYQNVCHFADIAEAVWTAKFVASMIAAEVPSGQSIDGLVIDISDGEGCILESVSFDAAARPIT